MRVLLIQGNQIQKFVLPETIDGNYWIPYYNTNHKFKDLLNVEAVDGKWKINTNQDIEIYYNNQIVTNSYLSDYEYYVLKIHGDNLPMILYVMPTYEQQLSYLKILQDQEFTVGSGENNAIICNNGLIESVHTRFAKVDGVFTVFSLKDGVGTYVNDILIKEKPLAIGDIIFIGGIKIIYIGSFIVVNNPKGSLRFSGNIFGAQTHMKVTYEQRASVDLAEIDLYSDNDYFHHTPRLRTRIEKEVVNIDDPPAKESMGEMPWYLTVGPMLMMAMTSMVSGASAVLGLVNGTTTFMSALPSLLMCFSMLAGTLLFPTMTKMYTKKQKKKKEEFRQKKYTQYLGQKEAQISIAMKNQKQILLENLLSFEECQNIILNKKRNLWEREIQHDDFLKVRLGIGNVPLQVEVNYSAEKFSLDEDNLKSQIQQIVSQYTTIKNVPVPMYLAEKYINALLGDDSFKDDYIKGLLLQLVTFHSYTDLKLVFLMNNRHTSLYDEVRFLPHCWSEDKQIRFYATNIEEMKTISSYLEAQFSARVDKMQEKDGGSSRKDFDYRSFAPYYLIITDSFQTVQNLGIINNILNFGKNIGFGLTIIANQLSELPNACNSFLYITKKSCGLFENELVSDRQIQFIPDEIPKIDMVKISKVLSNIPIEMSAADSQLPKMLTFLEMYHAGKIEQLNVLNRWKTSNPMMNLAVPVGVYPNGEAFKLDLHEKYHGPHGLIAGSTGSGKSEFIITYILSMAVNYHPDEVQFVLIDYKGGGLAGAFENRETGLKLPHLAGTITNLDTVEMKRSLASIQSELRRRQREFNKARDSLNESTIDIYKYQKLYREGLVKEPISHLFIISDEFAELKSQQPEFMAQLISTARIGRSLGVHLILATQKPSGVVNDQIWSNSKFKVCLKVQEKSDSMEMIKRPDAAAIKETGRFYLQVGYNEFFALGQSAWSGAKYYPTEKVKKKLDDSISFVNHVGDVEKNMNLTKVEVKEDKGEQLPNIVRFLVDLAERENIKVKQLWLERIPEFISLTNLREKYGYVSEKLIINPIIGEFDDPSNQRQALLTLDLTNNGNTIIYGMSGSGKENLIQTIIHASSIEHGVEEVNFYIVDFGAEVLKTLANYPHVGDIVTIEESEKLTNLFKMIDGEIERRKDLFIDYNGSYLDYCRNSGNIIPQIVVIINNFEMFSETFGMSAIDEALIKYTRTGNKYGITFIITANTANAVRYKLSQNFTKQLVLQMTNSSDYTTLLGKTEGVEPSKIFGRGIYKDGVVYEFQTAYIDNREHINDTIRATAQKLQGMTSIRASRVPVLPNVVTYDLLLPSITDIKHVPVGINKESLNVGLYDFTSALATPILAKNFNTLKDKINPLLRILSSFGTLAVIDASKAVDQSVIPDAIYYQDNFDEITQKLNSDANYRNNIVTGKETGATLESMPKIICVVIGLEEYKNSLSVDGLDILKMFVKSASVLKDSYSFVFIDSVDHIKAVEYEEWYKDAVSKSDGIWIGAGIDSQFVLQVENVTKQMREGITDSFGYLINQGRAQIIKFVSDVKEGEE